MLHERQCEARRLTATLRVGRVDADAGSDVGSRPLHPLASPWLGLGRRGAAAALPQTASTAINNSVGPAYVWPGNAAPQAPVTAKKREEAISRRRAGGGCAWWRGGRPPRSQWAQAGVNRAPKVGGLTRSPAGWNSRKDAFPQRRKLGLSTRGGDLVGGRRKKAAAPERLELSISRWRASCESVTVGRLSQLGHGALVTAVPPCAPRRGAARL
ncbi:hypothetical protein HYPSUDRAFT_205899 [Hypholoma sublateritium FD-334 SS-4]|uniref:Uncharacterized protein n=1 Tax=Hypholoma sublateritium (strain FD-334 SS-4) TaxID=945553 RepID=A0A0D2NM86_HYPSF|nr:hypothetical protein HYPSUDRAFT_205899 [Hypholoma sublateritium FD-334 SS-4]